LISKGKIDTIVYMPKNRILILLIVCASLASCYNPFTNPFGIFGGGDDDGDRPSLLPNRVVDPTAKLSLAVGGVLGGRDELVILDSNGDPRDFSGVTLECAADVDIVQILPRPGFATTAEGSGVRIVPIDPGIAAITCAAAGEDLGLAYEVTVPPQLLIQILIAEARGVLAEGATIDEETESVTLDSESPTANALGSVVRNRIWFTNSYDDTDLFGVDEEDYDLDPPVSYYDAVIMAEGQFAPTDPGDPNYAIFIDAERRIFMEGEGVTAYDQAVITAAGIFNGDIEDNTTGAFAFYTPDLA